MAKRTGARPSGARRGDARHIPDPGELIWLSFTPSSKTHWTGSLRSFTMVVTLIGKFWLAQ